MPTNETATISDGVRIGVCSLVGALYLIASILTVTINGLLLFVIFKDPLKCFRRPFAVLITGLTANDFLVGAIFDSLSAKSEFCCVKGKDEETNFDLVMYYFIDNSATALVLAVSVDRLLAVAFPIFYRGSVKATHSAIAVGVIWFYSLIFSLIQLTNIPEDIYDTVDVHLHVTSALVATAIIYFIIFLIIRKRRKLFPGEETTSQKTTQTLKNLKREREIAFTAFLILAVFVATQIPYLVLTIFESNCKTCHETTWFFVCHRFADFLLCITAIANPFLYGWRVKQFRSSFMAVFCRSKLNPSGLDTLQTNNLPTSEAMKQSTTKEL